MIQKVKNLLLHVKFIRDYARGKNVYLDPIYIKGKNLDSNPFYLLGKTILNDTHFLKVQEQSEKERLKRPTRTDVINFLLSQIQTDSKYLEIGVRNPEDNFNLVNADKKYSVDPGIEFKSNPVDFPYTSDDFFFKLSNNEILDSDLRFDVIFIDGLHLAEQVDRDIKNSLRYIKDGGFIVLHDCNPPTEWHARELYDYFHTPAQGYWNGTTWKAFMKWRFDKSVNSCCINSDWGIGVLSKNRTVGVSIEPVNSFFEFNTFSKNRKYYLNLMDFETFKTLISN